MMRHASAVLWVLLMLASGCVSLGMIWLNAQI